jgi:hypothetical protein
MFGAGEPRDVKPPLGDALVQRALTAAILGLLCCPPLLQIYSLCILFKISWLGVPLSARWNRLFWVAFLIDFSACFVTVLLVVCGLFQ